MVPALKTNNIKGVEGNRMLNKELTNQAGELMT